VEQPTVQFSDKAAQALRARLRGALLLPGDPGYRLARRLWNGAIQRHPGAIVTCADAEDVVHALHVAAEQTLAVTVRAGGHNVAGRAVCDGALLLDLSQLRSVTVNANNQSAIAAGGARWHEFDLATAPHGLATTGGLVSSTGVAGFTLGGGCGWLMRCHGLACDNLLAATVVLADGRIVRASREEHAELFWGLRGGAGGLGVTTSLEFRLYPQALVYGGLVIRAPDEALAALRLFRDYARAAADEFCGLAVLAHAPPLPFLHPAWHGRPVLIMALCWNGDAAAGERALLPLRQSGKPLVDHIGAMPYVVWQHLQDGNAPHGRCNYWKTASFGELPDNVLQTLVSELGALPTPQTEIHVQHLGGAVARVPVVDSAVTWRDAQFFVNLIGATPWHDEVPTLRERVRELHRRIAPTALAQRLANFSDQDDGDVLLAGGGDTARRLQALRRQYDPEGRFVRP
jgi:FAD/FMN-containing dehydrogenase